MAAVEFGEVILLIGAILLFCAVVVLFVLDLIRRASRMRAVMPFLQSALFFLSIIILTLYLCVRYGLSGRLMWANVLLGAAGALTFVGLAIVLDLLRIKQSIKIGRLTGIVIAVVLLLQLSVNVAMPVDFETGESVSPLWVFVRIVQNTFQYFSLDAQYYDILQISLEAYAGGGSATVFALLSCIMTVVAPIVGGFAIFGALGHFFPNLKLWRSIQPTKYIFSELNEYSISTAESIHAIKTELEQNPAARREYISKHGKAELAEIMHSAIIFTDVYTDHESEKQAELRQRATAINAICLKDDVLTRKIYWVAGWLYRLATHTKKKAVYFIMDAGDFVTAVGAEKNLQTAVSLLTAEKHKNMWAKSRALQLWTKTKTAELYVFSNSANADEIIESARTEWLRSYINGKALTDNKILGLSKKLLVSARKKEILDINVPTVDNKLFAAREKVEAALEAYAEDAAALGDVLTVIETEMSHYSDAYDKLVAAERILCYACPYLQPVKRYADVSCKVINEYRNLVYGLLDGYSDSAEQAVGKAAPLYKGLAVKSPNGVTAYRMDRLNVLVVGSGRIAKEFIKATYWCGQMLDLSAPPTKNGNPMPTKLRVAVMSIDADESFDALSVEMPEVFKTEFCNYKEERESYWEYRTISAALGTTEFKNKLDCVLDGSVWHGNKHEDGINSAPDYILIALGTDNLNLRAADDITRELRLRGLTDVPVSYVIENNELCEALRNRADGYAAANPFGSLKDRFDFHNIRMTSLERRAVLANNTYVSRGGVRNAFFSDTYSLNSSIASAMHTAYKRAVLRGRGAGGDRKNELCWLEHRRWCAFLRTEGYRPPTGGEFYDFALPDGDRKRTMTRNTTLRLHASLIECDSNGMTDAAVSAVADKQWLKGAVTDKKGELPEYTTVVDWLSSVRKEALFRAGRFEPTAEILKNADGLDMLGIVTGILNGDAHAKSFKRNDETIVKNLLLDNYCLAAGTAIFDMLHGGDANKLAAVGELKKIFALFESHDFSSGGGHGIERCVYNGNVWRCGDDRAGVTFAYIGKHNDCDMVAVCARYTRALTADEVKISGGKKMCVATFADGEALPDGKTEFALKAIADGNDCYSVIALRGGQGAVYSDTLVGKFFVCVGEYEGIKLLGIEKISDGKAAK